MPVSPAVETPRTATSPTPRPPGAATTLAVSLPLSRCAVRASPGRLVTVPRSRTTLRPASAILRARRHETRSSGQMTDTMLQPAAHDVRNPAEMASQVSGDVGFFDRFAGRAAGLASRAPFFAFCLLLVLIWLVQGLVILVATGSLGSFLDATYQLEINTTT